MYVAFKRRKTHLRYSPIQVAIEPTNVCNFSCNFCNQNDPGHSGKRKTGKIDMRDCEIILDKLKKSCSNLRILSLVLDGEPSLHGNLPKIIKKANQKGFFVRFSSNGTKIDRAFLEKTKNLSYLVSVDFSPDKAGFEKYRGRKDSWSLVNDNLKGIADYLDVNKNLHLEKAGTNLKRMKEHFGKMPRLSYSLRRYHKRVDGQSYNYRHTIYYGCFYPWTSLNVTWNGDVVTCCRDLDGKYTLGNILQSSIEDIWNGQKFLHLRDTILKQRLQSIPSCSSCDLPYDRERSRWDYAIQKVFRKW